MTETICSAHMHPLPCPGVGCRPTAAPMLVSAMKEYRAAVAAGELPPWIHELRLALGTGRAWLRWQKGDQDCAGTTLDDVEAHIADLRRAGWDGDDATVWRAAGSMAKFTGSMPWLPQRACELAEIRRWQDQLEVQNDQS